MGMIIVFLGLAAVLGTAFYFVGRRLFWDAWTGWRAQKQEAQEDQRRRLHTQALHREALDGVLAHLERQDAQAREAA